MPCTQKKKQWGHLVHLAAPRNPRFLLLFFPRLRGSAVALGFLGARAQNRREAMSENQRPAGAVLSNSASRASAPREGLGGGGGGPQGGRGAKLFFSRWGKPQVLDFVAIFQGAILGTSFLSPQPYGDEFSWLEPPEKWLVDIHPKMMSTIPGP